MTKRTGARRRAEIPAEILNQLNAGELETANLVEGLAIDFSLLFRNVVPGLNGEEFPALASDQPITGRMREAGRLLYERFASDAYDRFRMHRSDTVRSWAAFALHADESLNLKQRLTRIKKLADDPHFGVREWAWLAVRTAVAQEVSQSIERLTPWVQHKSPSIRRFAVELTRPRGVWCVHLPELKQKPELALDLLEPVRADSEKYVQDSVANWLNDASKSQPDWVQDLCDLWLTESPVPATHRICKRALRTIQKK